MARLLQVDTGQRGVKAEEKFKHRKGGWCWEARCCLDLCGIPEGFLEEVLFELGLGVRGIWMPNGGLGLFPEQSTESISGEGGGSLVPPRGKDREGSAPSVYRSCDAFSWIFLQGAFLRPMAWIYRLDYRSRYSVAEGNQGRWGC